MNKTIHTARTLYLMLVLKITAFVVVTAFLIWIPFIMKWGPPKSDIQKYGFETIYRNYDGPLFVVGAKTLYRPDKILELKTFSPEYFAVHMPGYPFFIRLFSYVFGYFGSMLMINVVGSILLGLVPHYFYQKICSISEPLYLVFVTLLWPRMWMVRSTGSSEILFILFVFITLLLVYKQKFLWACVFAFLASTVRMQGMLLGVAITLYWGYQIIREKREWKRHVLLFLPIGASALGFVFVCLFYYRQYGDFFAYFHSGVVVTTGIPYSQFFVGARGVAGHYLDDILFYFFVAWVSLLRPRKNVPLVFLIFGFVYLIFTMTVQHREISRYILPVIPLVIAINQDWLSRPYVKKALLILLPAVYLSIINFIANNSLPTDISLF